MKLYGDGRSGNCYKIQLALHLLKIPHEFIAMDIVNGDTQTEAYLALNPNGKIPLLQLDDGRCLAESNAILYYLAHGTELLPSDTYEQSLCLQWQNFEQYSHEPYIAVARFIQLYLGLPDDRLADYKAKQEGGHKALAIMEQHLSSAHYFVGSSITIADISLFAYTHVAHEGGFDLSVYPAISAWIERVESLPNFLPMQS